MSSCYNMNTFFSGHMLCLWSVTVIPFSGAPLSFVLKKLTNCSLASLLLLSNAHTHSCPAMHLCVLVALDLFSVFKLHFLCLELLRHSLTAELQSRHFICSTNQCVSS